MNARTAQIVALSDGTRSSVQIAREVSASPRYVRKILTRLNLPRLREGAQPGKANHQYVSGRRVDLDGYVLITVPSDHPYARTRTGRGTKLMYEHRYVMEQKLGRYLLPSEIVDHIDGLTLHNAPGNLRLFRSNGEHLAATLTGRKKLLSAEAQRKLSIAPRLRPSLGQVDNYARRRKSGDVRLRQILLTALKLDADSPFLLGTSRHTKKAGIDLSDRSKIQRALGDLYERWVSAHTL